MRPGKHLVAVGLVALVAAAALVVSGCGSASSSNNVPTVSLSRAADVSSAASGYKVAFTVHETIPTIGAIDGTGTGAFSTGSRLGAMTMNMSLPPSTGTGPLQMGMVLDRTTFYLKLPAELSSKLPGGKPWVYINLQRAAQAAGIPGLGALINSSSSLTDPGEYLSYLRATAVGTVKDLGQVNVNGVPTRHYSAEIDMSKLPDVVPASARQSVQQLVTALQAKGLTTRLPVQAWIDSSKLIRRLQVAFSEPVSGQSVSISLTENFLQYGPQPAPAIPSAGESTNLLSMANALGG
jgi:hypothetical protein